MNYLAELERASLAEATAAATLRELSQRVTATQIELNDATRSEHTRKTLRQVALASGDPLPEDAPIQSVLDLKDTLEGLRALVAKAEKEQKEAQAALKGVKFHALRAIQDEMEKEYLQVGQRFATLFAALLSLESRTGKTSVSMGRHRLYLPGLASHSDYNGAIPDTLPGALKPGVGEDEVNLRLKEKGL